MYPKKVALIFVLLLFVQGTLGKKCDCTSRTASRTAGAAVGGLGLLAGVTVGIAALGFGPLGIGAATWGASMMSAATTTGYGAGVVAGLQSVGAAGMAVGTKAAIVGTGAAAGYAASGGSDCEC